MGVKVETDWSNKEEFHRVQSSDGLHSFPYGLSRLRASLKGLIDDSLRGRCAPPDHHLA